MLITLKIQIKNMQFLIYNLTHSDLNSQDVQFIHFFYLLYVKQTCDETWYQNDQNYSNIVHFPAMEILKIKEIL